MFPYDWLYLETIIFYGPDSIADIHWWMLNTKKGPNDLKMSELLFRVHNDLHVDPTYRDYVKEGLLDKYIPKVPQVAYGWRAISAGYFEYSDRDDLFSYVGEEIQYLEEKMLHWAFSQPTGNARPPHVWIYRRVSPFPLLKKMDSKFLGKIFTEVGV